MSYVNVFLILFLIISEFPVIVYGFRVFNRNGIETILALENEYIAIQCKSNLPISYCGFLHPSGKRFSFPDTPLTNGTCVLKINATKEDVGEWKCNMGVKAIRVEKTMNIELRVVGQVAAVQSKITCMHGKSVTLACTTTRDVIPLKHCRFEPPTGSSFNIDSTVDITNPILGRYYFPPNKSMDRGDCSVTLYKVKYEDAGVWVCGAGPIDGQEYTAHIRLEVNASTTGIAVGGVVIAAIIVILGFIAWKKRWFLVGRRQKSKEEIEVQEAGTQSTPSGLPRVGWSIPRIVVQSPSDLSRSIS